MQLMLILKKSHAQFDPVLSKTISFVKNGWPKYTKNNTTILSYAK